MPSAPIPLQTALPTPLPFTDTADKDFGASSLSQDAKIFRNQAHIALGNGEPFQVRASGAAPGSYTVAASSLTADFFAVTEEFLYRAFSDGSVTLKFHPWSIEAIVASEQQE